MPVIEQNYHEAAAISVCILGAWLSIAEQFSLSLAFFTGWAIIAIDLYKVNKQSSLHVRRADAWLLAMAFLVTYEPCICKY